MSFLSEKIEAINPITGKKTFLNVRAQEDIGGGFDNKRLLKGNIELKRKRNFFDLKSFFRGMSKHTISLVERRVSKNDTDYILYVWKTFREIGLPVVPTLRITNKDTLLATDLKQDGSEIYGKAFNVHHLKRKDSVELSETDILFVNQFPQMRPLIEEKAYELIELATRNRIWLPRDDTFELLLHPSGQWELIILDLSLTEMNYPGDSKYLFENNRQGMATFFLSLDQIYSKMRKMLN